jgi:hypothetical protein
LASDLAEGLPDVAARASWGMKPPAATAPAPAAATKPDRLRKSRRVGTPVTPESGSPAA